MIHDPSTFLRRTAPPVLLDASLQFLPIPLDELLKGVAACPLLWQVLDQLRLERRAVRRARATDHNLCRGMRMGRRPIRLGLGAGGAEVGALGALHDSRGEGHRGSHREG